jgi:hypothetical protein
MGRKVNHLHNKVIEILESEPRAKLLELGSGGGNLVKQLKDKGFFDIHLFAYKYPELEYILFDTGFNVENIFSSVFESQARILSIICLPIMKLQAYFKCRRAKKKGDMDYNRIFKILFSPKLLYSRHLIIKARKRK